MRHTPCGCRSAHLVEVQPNFRLPPVSTMRRAQQAAFGKQSAAEQTSLAPHDSKARLIVVTTRRDSWRSHVHRTHTAQRVQLFELQTANVGGRGGLPSPFSGGFKGGILFGKRIPPLVPRRARRSPSRASAGKRMQRCRAAIESPAPYRRKKGAALSGCINSPRPLGAKKAALARGNKKRSLFRGSFFSGISHYIQRNY